MCGQQTIVFGKSRRMQELLAVVRMVADTEAPIIIIGETGVGKTVLAIYIHDLSARRDKPFKRIHCGSTLEQLLLNELYGHEPEAFTGAHRRKKGLAAFADGGTLFLDEVEFLSDKAQGALLDLTQFGQFRPLGSVEDIRVSFRIIAATGQDLHKHVEEGLFSRALYHRLKVIEIEVPPLRDRLEDVPELCSHFLRHHAKTYGKNITGVEPDAMASMQAYQWPGNIRELEHAIERAVILAPSSTLTLSDLPPEIQAVLPRVKTLQEVEDEYLSNALDAGKWDVPQVANDIGMDPSTLRRKARRLRDAENLHAPTSLRPLAEILDEHIREVYASCGGNNAKTAALLDISRNTLTKNLRRSGLLQGGERAIEKSSMTK